jgi:hypothetical protein
LEKRNGKKAISNSNINKKRRNLTTASTGQRRLSRNLLIRKLCRLRANSPLPVKQMLAGPFGREEKYAFSIEGRIEHTKKNKIESTTRPMLKNPKS